MWSKLLRSLPNPIPTFPRGQSQARLWEEPEELPTRIDPARPMNNLGIRLGEHWAVVGMTGSGKSYFAQALLEYLRRRYPTARRYVLDSTADGMESVRDRIDVIGNRVPDLLRDSAHTLIWTPDTDVPALYHQWFEKILYKREPAVVLVDELASLTKGRSGEPPDGFIKLLKQGRKHKITVISLTQQVSRVTTTIFGQMGHFAQFRINQIPYDKMQVRIFLGVAKEDQKPPSGKYGFFYRRTGGGTFAMREFSETRNFFKDTI